MDKMKLAFAAVVLLAFAGVGYMAASAPDYSRHSIDSTIPESSGQQPSTNGQAAGAQAGELQVVSIRALSTGLYDNPRPTVKAGQPVRLDFTADPGSGCGAQLILDGLGTPVNLVSRNGQTVSVTFTPPAPGQYRFHCGMNMFRGVLTAT